MIFRYTVSIYSPGAAVPTLVVLKSPPNVERCWSVVVQLIGLVDYISLKKSIWW